MTSVQRLTRNTLWNLLGQGLPLAAAVFAIPILVRHLGTDRFGILTLVWMAIGYFSVFDLGLGRALTKLVAGKLGSREVSDIPALVWTTIYLMIVLGLLGMSLLWLLAQPLVEHLLNIPASMQTEALNAFRLLGLSIPIVVLTSALRGFLEAKEEFGLVNLVRVPMGLATFVGPLLVLPFSISLVPVTCVLLLIRMAALLVHWQMCLSVMPTLRGRIPLRRDISLALLTFGGWMTVTNLVGPMMVYMDRFLIGGLVSMAAVAYYVAPYELITKLLIFPMAISGVLFPAFSASMGRGDVDCGPLYWLGIKVVFLVLFPCALLTTLFAGEILNLWLGPVFSAAGTPVLQLLTAGVLVNSLAFIPFALIQSAGRPDITAKLHFIELPFYVFGIWILVTHYGLVGVALAWSLRALADAVAMFMLVARLVPATQRTIGPLIPLLVSSISGLALAALCPTDWPKLLLTFIFTLLFAAWVWIKGLNPGERQFVLKAVGRSNLEE